MEECHKKMKVVIKVREVRYGVQSSLIYGNGKHR